MIEFHKLLTGLGSEKPKRPIGDWLIDSAAVAKLERLRIGHASAAGEMLLPSYSKGSPVIPQKNYDYLAILPADRHVDSETRRELNIPSNIFD